MTTVTAPVIAAGTLQASAPGLARRALTTVSLIFSALGDGLAAHETYNALRARGVPHADAATQAFAQR
jgi:hypothetical protein